MASEQSDLAPMRRIANLEPHRAHWFETARLSLESFLSSNQRLDFVEPNRPNVSVLIVSYNSPELLLKCLLSLHGLSSNNFEVLVFDNASGPLTHVLLDRIVGLKKIISKENLHFLRAANALAEAARGENLLFLNSDCELLPGALALTLAAAESTFNADTRVGALGSMVLNCDLSVQEAGGVIDSAGKLCNRGQFLHHSDPSLQQVTDVDFLNGAFLMTPRRLFQSLGGFDPRFAPAYFEDVEYCLRLKKAGWRCVVDPQIKVIHLRHGSAIDPKAHKEIMRVNLAQLQTLHSDILEASP